jgi:transcriptional regulator with XRE-family HTH domain
MPDMHPSMARLYEAAAQVDPRLRGQSELAREIGQSPQNIKNWETRKTGVSASGASQVQQRLGISANWILEGAKPMFVREGGARQSQSAGSMRDIMAAAVTIARRVQDMAIEPIEGERYIQLLTEAATMVQESGTQSLSGASLDDAAREVAARLRSTG